MALFLLALRLYCLILLYILITLLITVKDRQNEIGHRNAGCVHSRHGTSEAGRPCEDALIVAIHAPQHNVVCAISEPTDEQGSKAPLKHTHAQ